MSQRKCPECNGKGVYIPDSDEYSTSNEQARGAPCPVCNGTGKVDDDD